MLNKQRFNYMSRKIYMVEGLDCQVCAYSIQMELENEGIKCLCSFPKQTLVVEDINNNEEKKIKKVVESYGFELIDIIN